MELPTHMVQWATHFMATCQKVLKLKFYLPVVLTAASKHEGKETPEPNVKMHIHAYILTANSNYR